MNKQEMIKKMNEAGKIGEAFVFVIDFEMKNWIDEYLSNPVEITYVFIAFEYLNSFSTTILVSILKKISQVILQLKKLVIKWYYEEGDEDILERGEYISSNYNIPIEFIMTNNIAGC